MSLKIIKNNFSFNVVEDKLKSFWLDVESDIWEDETFRIIDKYFKNDVFIDIGAWIGPISLYVSQRYSAQVLAIEPDKTAFKTLQKNIRLNPKVKDKIISVNAALGAFDGTSKLFYRTMAGDSMSSFLKRSFDAGFSDEIKVMTFETVLKKHAISKIGFIKMDIEGGEFEIFRTIRNEIMKDKPTILLAIHTPFLIESYFQNFLSPKISKYLLNINWQFKTRLNFDLIHFFFRKKLANDFKGILDIAKKYKFVYEKDGRLITLKSYKDILNTDSILITDHQW